MVYALMWGGEGGGGDSTALFQKVVFAAIQLTVNFS